MRGDCKELEGGGAEGLAFGKFLFSSVLETPATFSAGTFEGAGNVNSELPLALLFSAASSFDTASNEEAELWIKSPSNEFSRLTGTGFVWLPKAWDESSLFAAPEFRPPPGCSEGKASGPPIWPDETETFLSGLIDDS